MLRPGLSVPPSGRSRTLTGRSPSTTGARARLAARLTGKTNPRAEQRLVVRRARTPIAVADLQGSGGFVFRLRTGTSGIGGKEMADFVQLLKRSPRTRILTAGGDALDQTRRFAIFFQDLNGFI